MKTLNYVAVIGLLVYSCWATAQSGISLSINDRVIAAAGDVEEFSFDPISGLVTIRTFYGDVRCSGLSQTGSGTAAIELDSYVNEAEDLAVYDLFADGSIEYQPSSRIISIQTGSDGSGQVQAPDCTHLIEEVGIIGPDGVADPGVFDASDFESLVDVSVESIQSGFRIRVQNRTTVDPLRNIQVRFTSSETFLLAPGAGVSEESEGVWLWEVPLLWPDDGTENSGIDEATLDLAYTDASSASLVIGPDTGSDATSKRILSWKRKQDPQTDPALITVVNTSTTRSF